MLYKLNNKKHWKINFCSNHSIVSRMLKSTVTHKLIISVPTHNLIISVKDEYLHETVA